MALRTRAANSSFDTTSTFSGDFHARPRSSATWALIVVM
jgi:hypothetical protein